MASNPQHSPRQPDQAPGDWWRIAGIGFEFIAAVAVLAAIGLGIDKWLGSNPWGVLAGCVLGFVVGLTQLVRSAKKMFHD